MFSQNGKKYRNSLEVNYEPWGKLRAHVPTLVFPSPKQSAGKKKKPTWGNRTDGVQLGAAGLVKGDGNLIILPNRTDFLQIRFCIRFLIQSSVFDSRGEIAPMLVGAAQGRGSGALRPGEGKRLFLLSWQIRLKQLS